MKTIVMILGVLLISFSAFAQAETSVKQSDLKGPAYKNYKSWTHKAVPTKVYTNNNKKELKGPAYKNYQVARDNSNKDLVLVSTVGNERQNLTGPAYKNYGPWVKTANKDDASTQVGSTSTKEDNL
ncbi:hypothetical protein [Flavobacterium faecale]|uniref:hypothetical protein n=1 Tax=Flavobacterium faecale TaxID=1355330 RepID=UPI003AAB41CA